MGGSKMFCFQRRKKRHIVPVNRHLGVSIGLSVMYNRFEDPKHIRWSRAVKKRDHFTCIICKKTNIKLHSHHCNSWDSFEEQRFDVNNGVTLCESCHGRFHNIYGIGKNTVYQFEEFMKVTRIMHKIIKLSRS